MAKKHRRWPWVLMGLGLALTIFLALGLRNDLTLTHYRLDWPDIEQPIHIAILTDLHGQSYGLNQSDLLARVASINPDIVLLGGDIVDDEEPEEPAWVAMEALAQAYPTFYVSGNHEFWSGEIERIKAGILGLGIPVLEGDAEDVLVGDVHVRILGLDDPDASPEVYYGQVAALATQEGEADFTVLLSHRPEEVFGMDDVDFDLAVSGHAHGGQWRIPGILPGVFSPNQGMFPEFTAGFYDVAEGKQLLVSRGLSKDSTRVPRFYNPPEILHLEIY